jgi:hypothetical protein
MSIDYRKWLISALVGLAAPLLIDQRLIQPDHVCSATEQIQVEAMEAKAKNSWPDVPVAPGPDCFSAQQQAYLVNHLPEAARDIVWFSFCISALGMILFGFALWPLGRGATWLIRAAGNYITRRGERGTV